MFKRLLWLSMGIGFGFGVSFWIVRLVREKVARYSPERVTESVADTLRDVARELREALAEGAAAMREREAALRESLDGTVQTRR